MHARSKRLKCGGFTLMEMLLVVMIIAVAVAMSTPYMVNSIRGNRLRSASRSVVQAARYARTMAILDQMSYVVTYDTASDRILVDPGQAPTPMAAGPEALPLNPSLAAPVVSETPVADEAAPPRAASRQGIVRELTRVRIVEVTSRSDIANEEGTTSKIIYQRNGRCVPHEVQLEDESGATMRISVDALGSVRTEEGYTP